MLCRALLALASVNWPRVDPAAGTRPVENLCEAPVFQSGDKVPWCKQREGVDVCAALWLPSGVRYGALAPEVGTLRSNITRNGRWIAPAWFWAGGVVSVECLHSGAKPHGWQKAARDDLYRTCTGQRGRGGYRVPGRVTDKEAPAAFARIRNVAPLALQQRSPRCLLHMRRRHLSVSAVGSKRFGGVCRPMSSLPRLGSVTRRKETALNLRRPPLPTTRQNVRVVVATLRKCGVVSRRRRSWTA